jgi:porphyrinogen peroxidase
MTTSQPGILAANATFARYLEFSIVADTDPAEALKDLAGLPLGDTFVIGLGPGLIQGLGTTVEGLRGFPALSGPGLEVPSTQADVWCWVRGDDRGHILHSARAIEHVLGLAFSLERQVDGFTYDAGLDLSGYVDGTENPEGEAALEAGIVQGQGAGLDGASFVATQMWQHDLDYFDSLEQDDRDNIIGRRISDNEEIDDAPVSAHVKRTAQESFDPEAFIVRRSMPWADVSGEGLMFVAFGKDLDAFEVQLRRMTGLEDGITDGIYRFSKPVSGAYFWCPPVLDGHLDLRAIGL